MLNLFKHQMLNWFFIFPNLQSSDTNLKLKIFFLLYGFHHCLFLHLTKGKKKIFLWGRLLRLNENKIKSKEKYFFGKQFPLLHYFWKLICKKKEYAIFYSLHACFWIDEIAVNSWKGCVLLIDIDISMWIYS